VVVRYGARRKDAGRFHPGRIKLWDVDSGQLRRTLKGHRGDVGLALATDLPVLASAGDDKTIRL